MPVGHQNRGVECVCVYETAESVIVPWGKSQFPVRAVMLDEQSRARRLQLVISSQNLHGTVEPKSSAKSNCRHEYTCPHTFIKSQVKRPLRDKLSFFPPLALISAHNFILFIIYLLHSTYKLLGF